MEDKRFLKRIASVLCMALFALLYVHQQIEVMKTSFIINKKRHEISFLLDQYRGLVYNLSKLESPKRIEDKLSQSEITLCMPKTANIHREAKVKLVYDAGESPKSESFLAKLFDRFSTKAEAKVVKGENL